MDSNASGFLMNPSVYYQDDRGISIDLGLSLKTLQSEVYHPSGHLGGLEGYDRVMNWPQANPSVDQSNASEEESEGVQSKERWAFVKVNMDGVMVGRKICMLDLGGYSSLAIQLEDMFGSQSPSGLRLFQSGSEFCLLYKDSEDNWRTAGDVPWREFVECVKRLRIARKYETFS